MLPGTVLLTTNGDPSPWGYVAVCSGYLVRDGRVLLVHHNRFGKWVPPGGHLEPGETFAQAAERECLEETGLRVRALSAAPVLHPPDTNATPSPAPFYVDIEREGFAQPALTQFFFLELADASSARITAQLEEVHEVAWFTRAQLPGLATFAQVRSLAAYALEHHPRADP